MSDSQSCAGRVVHMHMSARPQVNWAIVPDYRGSCTAATMRQATVHKWPQSEVICGHTLLPDKLLLLHLMSEAMFRGTAERLRRRDCTRHAI